jgi:hypothetical protein
MILLHIKSSVDFALDLYKLYFLNPFDYYVPKERLNITLDPSGAIAKICMIPL